MPKIVRDVSDVNPEESAGKVYEVAPAGIHEASVYAKITKPSGKDQRWELQVRIPGYATIYEYINMVAESQREREDQFLQALGLTNAKTRKVTLNTADDGTVKEVNPGKCRVRVYHQTETYEGTDRIKPRIGTWLPSEQENGGEDEPSLTMLGAAADGGDDGAIAHLTSKAGEVDLDPDNFGTWAELAEAIEAAEPEEEEEEPEPAPAKKAAKATKTAKKAAPAKKAAKGKPKEDIIALGNLADDNEEDAQQRLTELAGEKDLDPDDFPTWLELAQKIEGGDDEKPDYNSWTLAALKEEAGNRDIDIEGKKKADIVTALEEYDEDPFSS